MTDWMRALDAALIHVGREEVNHLLRRLEERDTRLVQGGTTVPPPLHCTMDWPCEAACPLATLGWTSGLVTVGEVEEFFARLCYQMDQTLGEPAGCRHLLNWVDETPREEAFGMLARRLRELGYGE